MIKVSRKAYGAASHSMLTGGVAVGPSDHRSEPIRTRTGPRAIAAADQLLCRISPGRWTSATEVSQAYFFGAPQYVCTWGHLHIGVRDCLTIHLAANFLQRLRGKFHVMFTILRLRRRARPTFAARIVALTDRSGAERKLRARKHGSNTRCLDQRDAGGIGPHH
jgi:hypothetical protein